MKFKCPHCSRAVSLSDEKLRALLPAEEASAGGDSPPRQHFCVMLIIVGIAVGGMVGFVGGALLTRPMRNRTAAEIAKVQAEANAKVLDATQTAKESSKDAQQANAKVRGLELQIETLTSEATRLKQESAKAPEKVEAEQKLAGGHGTQEVEPVATGRVESRDLSTAIATARTLRTPFFDVNLGEKLDVLRRRCAVRPSTFSYTDEDHPGAIYDILAVPAGVSALRVLTVGDRVYGIMIDFADTTETNLDALTKQLESKYGHRRTGDFSGSVFGENTFAPTIDGEDIWITINRDLGFGEPDTLRLTYHHATLSKAIQAEIERRKASRVSDKL